MESSWEAAALWSSLPAAKAKDCLQAQEWPTALRILAPAALWVFRNLRVRTFGKECPDFHSPTAQGHPTQLPGLQNAGARPVG